MRQRQTQRPWWWWSAWRRAARWGSCLTGEEHNLQQPIGSRPWAEPTKTGRVEQLIEGEKKPHFDEHTSRATCSPMMTATSLWHCRRMRPVGRWSGWHGWAAMHWQYGQEVQEVHPGPDKTEGWFVERRIQMQASAAHPGLTLHVDENRAQYRRGLAPGRAAVGAIQGMASTPSCSMSTPQSPLGKVAIRCATQVVSLFIHSFTCRLSPWPHGARPQRA